MAVPVQVTDCYFPKDKYLNRRKNFCFVTFATQQVHASAKVYRVIRRHVFMVPSHTGVLSRTE